MKHKPSNYTEEEILQIIDKVVSRLAPKFKFGYHSLEDMKQEGRLLALRGLEKYDGVRSLENFLWTHVRNRLYNFKRNNFERPDRPCLSCPFYDPDLRSECKKYEDTSECSLYYNWKKRNTTKKNLMTSASVDITFEYEGDTRAEETEVQKLIEQHLPVEHREDYLRLKNNLKLPKVRKQKILEVIRNIIDMNNLRLDI